MSSISIPVINEVVARIDNSVREHERIFSLTDEDGDLLIVNGADEADGPGALFYLAVTTHGLLLNAERARLLIAFLALQLELTEGATP